MEGMGDGGGTFILQGVVEFGDTEMPDLGMWIATCQIRMALLTFT